MPIVNSNYNPPWRYKNTYIQTSFPSLFRKIPDLNYQRQRLITTDGDFIDLDWSPISFGRTSDSLAILCHGLEGSSERAYMTGMAQAFNRKGVDAVAYNYRGCSGEPNLQKKYYTAGATDDLQDVLNAIKARSPYPNIYLVGFSLGANLVLKYAGENGQDIDSAIKGVVAISAPCDLASSSRAMLHRKNILFNIRFLKMLFEKIRAKFIQYPELRDIDLKSIRNLKQFDDQITAPLAGYKDAEDYWYQASCIRDLTNITVPTLILNAADDPILGPECYPYKEAESSHHIFLEVPQRGGHVGFMHRPNQPEYWHETRAVDFLLQTNS